MKKKELLKIVKQLRKSHGFTQQQMADKLKWGKQSYERLENGRTQAFDLDEITSIAQIFQLTATEMMEYHAPHGQVKTLLKEGIALFRESSQLFQEAQQKIDEAERLLNNLETKEA
ncbi:helix-turn-helix transcriptional regulator [uncultured Microscilla sp.]|uniref:helix-turn-helix transcriptional regulator n=1 Tax=uncultured Microscilla sp. TaxID=432653 RepID=UPI002628F015|nr:helix-turn-helix transcriptional regulator [uncultured Microscilla sp.]